MDLFRSTSHGPRRPLNQTWRVFLTTSIPGLLLLTLIGNWVWEILARPGLSEMSRILLEIVTLGSSKIRDLPYSIAPVNPYSLPSLLLLLFAVSLIPVPAVWVVATPFIESRLKKRAAMVRSRAATPGEAHESISSYLKSSIRTTRITLIVYIAIVYAGAFIAFNVATQAILIRRTHEANMDIVAPYLNPEQRLQLQAQFAGMTTKAEYVAFEARLKAIAVTNRVRLREE